MTSTKSMMVENEGGPETLSEATVLNVAKQVTGLDGWSMRHEPNAAHMRVSFFLERGNDAIEFYRDDEPEIAGTVATFTCKATYFDIARAARELVSWSNR